MFAVVNPVLMVVLPLNAIVPVVSVKVTVFAFTVLEKVTPALLWVTVILPAVPAPTAPIVASPPALVIVSPPARFAIDVNPMVAPAVLPEFSVRLFPPLVTAPTARVAAALFPVASDVAPPNVMAPRLIAVFVVATFPIRVTVDGLVAPVVVNPPVNVVVSVARLLIANVPVFKKLVAPAIEFEAPLKATL